MGKAGKVLRQVLKTYGISQNKLSIVMEVRSSVVYRWFHDQVDPTAETVVNIVKALNQIDPEAAKAFVQLHLGEIVDGQSAPQE